MYWTLKPAIQALVGTLCRRQKEAVLEYNLMCRDFIHNQHDSCYKVELIYDTLIWTLSINALLASRPNSLFFLSATTLRISSCKVWMQVESPEVSRTQRQGLDFPHCEMNSDCTQMYLILKSNKTITSIY